MDEWDDEPAEWWLWLMLLAPCLALFVKVVW